MTLSRAQEAFVEFRPEIAEQLRIAEALTEEVKSGRRMSPQENQLRHVEVSLIALIQAYLAELLEEKADELCESWDELSEVNRRYVAVQARKRLSAVLDDLSESDLAEPRRVEILKVAISECATWHNTPSSLARSVHRQKLDGFLQNNGSKTLDRAISSHGNCGMAFFPWLQKVHPRYRGIEEVLNIIIATRNDIAHGSFERRLTLRDVRIHRVLIYRLVSKIGLYIAMTKDDLEPYAFRPKHEDIAYAAYQHWLDRGCKEGRADEDWISAERKLTHGRPCATSNG